MPILIVFMPWLFLYFFFSYSQMVEPTVMLADVGTDPWTQRQGTLHSLHPQFCHDVFILDPLLISRHFN